MDVAIGSDGIFSQVARSGVIPILEEQYGFNALQRRELLIAHDDRFDSSLPSSNSIGPLISGTYFISVRIACFHSDLNQVLFPLTMTRAKPGEMILDDNHIIKSQTPWAPINNNSCEPAFCK